MFLNILAVVEVIMTHITDPTMVVITVLVMALATKETTMTTRKTMTKTSLATLIKSTKKAKKLLRALSSLLADMDIEALIEAKTTTDLTLIDIMIDMADMKGMALKKEVIKKDPSSKMKIDPPKNLTKNVKVERNLLPSLTVFLRDWKSISDALTPHLKNLDVNLAHKLNIKIEEEKPSSVLKDQEKIEKLSY